MSRTITVSGGFSGTVVFDLADTLKQLQGSTFSVALTEVGADDPPPVADASWSAATAVVSSGTATVSLVVDDETPTGQYNAVLDVQRDGRHEAVWAMDRRDRRRRALVIVT